MLSLLPTTGNVEAPAISELFQANLAAIGVRLDIAQARWLTMLRYEVGGFMLEPVAGAVLGLFRLHRW